jgi:hypothetical protein
LHGSVVTIEAAYSTRFNQANRPVLTKQGNKGDYYPLLAWRPIHACYCGSGGGQRGNPIPPWDWRHHADLPPELKAKVIGNRQSLVYHRPTCANAARIAERNRVTFDSEEAAAAVGYRPGKDCHK